MSSQTKDLVVISSTDVSNAACRAELLKEYVKGQMDKGKDYGIIPGFTSKPSLFKPGAEKLARLFKLGSRIIETKEVLNLEKNFAMYTYRIEIYLLDSGTVVAQCEGSANSQEKKYMKLRAADVLNTLQKMAQKRAFVGGVISAVGASEFYTQDVEDIAPDKDTEADPVTIKEVLKHLIPTLHEKYRANANKKLEEAGDDVTILQKLHRQVVDAQGKQPAA